MTLPTAQQSVTFSVKDPPTAEPSHPPQDCREHGHCVASVPQISQDHHQSSPNFPCPTPACKNVPEKAYNQHTLGSMPTNALQMLSLGKRSNFGVTR